MGFQISADALEAPIQFDNVFPVGLENIGIKVVGIRSEMRADGFVCSIWYNPHLVISIPKPFVAGCGSIARHPTRQVASDRVCVLLTLDCVRWNGLSMINNAKYGGKSILPELRVIESGVLKGFVTISPKWAGFKAADYLQASMSVYTDDTYYGQPAEGDATFEVAAGDFDLRGFEVTNSSLFDANKRPYVLFQSKQIKFSTDCVRQFGKDNKVELLIHPGLRKLAVRRASKDSRQCVQWSKPDDGKYYAKEIPCTAFGGTLFELLDWETDFKFRAYGRLLQNEGDSVFIFDLSEPEIFIQSYGVICAVATLERIYTKYGYHVLDRTLRLCVGTWEGDIDSLGANVLAGVARMVVAFGDQLRDETFKERVGFMSVRQLSRIAKERGAGSLCYAEAMLVAYNRKCKYTLRMTKLHSGKVAAEDDFVEENEEPLADDPVLEE